MNPPGRKLFARKWLTHILMWLYRVVKPATKSPTAVNGASIWYSARCKTSRRASAISAPVRFPPSCKTAAELLQSVRTPFLLWNLLLNMWNLCLLLLLQGVVVFLNDYHVSKSWWLRLNAFWKLCFLTLLFIFLTKELGCSLQELI